jgi:hypothetical protein
MKLLALTLLFALVLLAYAEEMRLIQFDEKRKEWLPMSEVDKLVVAPGKRDGGRGNGKGILFLEYFAW